MKICVKKFGKEASAGKFLQPVLFIEGNFLDLGGCCLRKQSKSKKCRVLSAQNFEKI